MASCSRTFNEQSLLLLEYVPYLIALLLRLLLLINLLWILRGLRQSGLGRRRQRMRIPPLMLHQVPVLTAANPQLCRNIVVSQIVLEPVGTVIAQPGLLVQLAQLRVAVANILEPAVDRADGPQSLSHLACACP